MLAMFDRCGGRGDGVLPAAALVKLYVRAIVRAQRCSQSSWWLGMTDNSLCLQLLPAYGPSTSPLTSSEPGLLADVRH